MHADHEPAVQEQAICFVRNLVDGSVDSIEYIFSEEAIIFHAIVRQLRSASKSEVCIQVRSLENYKAIFRLNKMCVVCCYVSELIDESSFCVVN